MTCSTVDFPAPFGPSTASTSPGVEAQFEVDTATFDSGPEFNAGHVGSPATDATRLEPAAAQPHHDDGGNHHQQDRQGHGGIGIALALQVDLQAAGCVSRPPESPRTSASRRTRRASGRTPTPRPRQAREPTAAGRLVATPSSDARQASQRLLRIRRPPCAAAPSIAITRNGNDTNVWASTTADVVNAIWIPAASRY